MIPGLIDSHIHTIRGGLSYNLELRWEGVPSLGEALARRSPVAAYGGKTGRANERCCAVF